MTNCSDRVLINDLKFLTGYDIMPINMERQEIINRLVDIYPGIQDEEKVIDNNMLQDTDYSTIEFVNKAIQNAVDTKVSDIHFEAYEKFFRVRFRIDGHLREIANQPSQKGLPIISRIKVMANLDISEKRRPQDGRIKYVYKNKSLDIRVSSLPTSFGEKIVLRILDKTNLKLDVKKLGLLETQRELLLRKNSFALWYDISDWSNWKW